MEKTRNRGRQYVLRLLTIKDRTAAELVDKLRRKGFNEDVTSSIIAEMKDLGYVDDKRYAMHFAEVRANYDLFGPYRIRVELEKRGIAREMAKDTVSCVFQEGKEEANALELARRWIARKDTDDIERAGRRLYGYLARRGFTPDVVRRTLRQVLK
jgi:regulatory protein